MNQEKNEIIEQEIVENVEQESNDSQTEEIVKEKKERKFLKSNPFKSEALKTVIFNKNFFPVAILSAFALVVIVLGVSLATQLAYIQISKLISAGTIPQTAMPAVIIAKTVITMLIYGFMALWIMTYFASKAMPEKVKFTKLLFKRILTTIVMILIITAFTWLLSTVATFILSLFTKPLLIIALQTRELITINWKILLSFLYGGLYLSFIMLFGSFLFTYIYALLQNEFKLKGSFAIFGELTCGRKASIFFYPFRFIHWMILIIVVIPVFVALIYPMITTVASNMATTGSQFATLYALFIPIAVIAFTWIMALFAYIVVTICKVLQTKSPGKQVILSAEELEALKEFKKEEKLAKKASQEELKAEIAEEELELAAALEAAKAKEDEAIVSSEEVVETPSKEDAETTSAETK